MRKPDRQAMTVVELLVGIAIIGILASLILPSVQSAREAARKMQCLNNLHQIGIAMTSYETSFRRLPSGYLSELTRDGSLPSEYGLDSLTWDAGPGWGWGAAILPFLGEVALDRHINHEVPIWHESNRTAIARTIPTYLCPSASGPRQPFIVQDENGDALEKFGRPLQMGRSSYVANHGQESCWGAGSAAPTAIIFDDIYEATTREVAVQGETKYVADGPFFRNSELDLSAITDGLSHTMFIGEHTSRMSDKSWAGVVPGAFTHPRVETFENGAESAATLVLFHVGPSGGELDIAGVPIIHPVNFPTYHVCQMVSDHAGGGNILFGDGTVRFVSEDIDLILAAQMASMNESDTQRIGEER